MPAVDPRRLRFQMDELMEFFESPVQFHQHLQGLFSLYANRALRLGDSVPTQPLMPVYNLPQPVIRQLQIDLDRKIKDNPQAALALADELWHDSHMEVKQTAIRILGAVHIDEPEPILSRLSQWMSPELDKNLTNLLFSTGTHQLQNLFPEDWERFIISLLEKKQAEWIALGVKGLSEGMENPNFQNLPAIFRLISPVIREPHPAFMPNLHHLISKSIQRSPAETALFLKQTLSMSDSSRTTRLIKDCVDLFPHEFRRELEMALGE